MPSCLDQILSKADSALAELNVLRRRDYTSEQLKELPKTLGSETEVFLKIAAFPTRNPRGKFYDFIAALRTVGVADIDIQALHDLRESYNAAKHQPSYDPSLSAIESMLSAAQRSLANLRTLNFGRIHDLTSQRFRRTLWLFAWDHYIGGDTEISIMIPSFADELPPDLDLIYIDGLEWDNALRALKQVGQFQLGDHLFPDKIHKFFAGEGDFLAAGVFEGAYADLIATLARFERRQELIPGLNRRDSPVSMLQAILLATVDAVAISDVSLENLEQRIRELAETKYAVPPNVAYVARLSRSVSKLVTAIDVTLWRAIAGPTWISATEFEGIKPTALSISQDLPVLIDQDCVIRIGSR